MTVLVHSRYPLLNEGFEKLLRSLDPATAFTFANVDQVGFFAGYRESPQLVFVLMYQPEEDWDLCRKIKVFLENIKIVVLLGVASAHFVEGLKANGADYVLENAFQDAEIDKKLLELPFFMEKG